MEKELRIGNVVWDYNVIHPTEKYVTVEEIGKDWCLVRNDRGTYYIKHRLLKPVSLTEEILLKCGFVKIGLFLIKGKFKIFENKALYFTGSGPIKTDLQYLHNLQNIMKDLDDEELIFEL